MDNMAVRLIECAPLSNYYIIIIIIIFFNNKLTIATIYSTKHKRHAQN